MVKIFLLGEQRLWRPGQDAHVPASRSFELLAYLALHAGLEVSRQLLAGLFWPNSADQQSLTNLRRELHHLRGLLDDGGTGGSAGLRIGRTALRWTDSPACRVDVCVFRAERDAALAAAAAGDEPQFLVHAQRGIDEYRGDLLPGAFADWVLEQRDELRGECVRLCDQSVAALRRSHDLAQAIVLARRRVRLEPLEESGYRLLMDLQASLGDRAAAMTTYHRVAAILEQELGVRPDPATTALLEQLLGTESAGTGGSGRDSRPAAEPVGAADSAGGAGGPGMRVEADPVHPTDRAGPPGVGDPAGHKQPELVGRAREVAQLEAGWLLALDHQPGLLLITGEAGVGKTRLAAELMAKARASGAVVAQSRCFSRPGRIPLAPVADWLRSPALWSCLPALAPVWRNEVNRLLPEMESDPGGAGNAGAGITGAATGAPAGVEDRSVAGFPAPAADNLPATSRAMVDAWQRHRFFEGLARAVLVQDRPVLLVLDDLQWGDAETVSWLAFLLGYAHESRLFVVATARPDELEAAADLAPLLHPMQSAGLITRLRLDPLTPEAAAALTASLTGRNRGTDQTAILYAATGGYPLYIVEAARIAPEPATPEEPLGVSDLESVLQRRLGQASEAARGLAALAAAYGHDVSLELLSEAGDLGIQELVTAVDELWRLRILRIQGHGYDFVHDLLREAAYEAVSPAGKWLLHRRLAQALELLFAGRLDDVAAQLGEQYRLGGRGASALEHYRRAAEIAVGVFANVEALRYYRRCLEIIESLPPGESQSGYELEVLRAMSAPLTAVYGYSSPELQATLERTEELAQQLGRPKVLLSSLIGLFSSRFVQGRTALSFRTAERALALAQTVPDQLGQAHFAFAGAALGLGRPQEAISHFDRAIELSPDRYSYILGTKLEVHARAWSAHALWLAGEDDAALARCQNAVERGRAAAHPYSLAIALAYAAVLYQLRNDREALASSSVELQEICRRYDFAYYGQWGLIMGGWLAGGQTGAETVRSGIRMLRTQGAFARMPYWLGLLAETRMGYGQFDKAATALDAAVAAVEQHDDRWWQPEVLRLRSLLADDDKAADLLRQARELALRQQSLALVARCAAESAAAEARYAVVVPSVPATGRPGT
jgi:DNA-binding SARP family transcriptional activator/tetratricopeptide (TPR) repeat protein